MANVPQWNTSASSNTDAPPDGAPEGIAPSTVNDIIRENMAAVARWYADSVGSLVSGGSGNTYTLTTNTTYTSMGQVPPLTFRADRANTGAITLNVDGLGAFSVVTADGSTLDSGALVADMIYTVVADTNASPDRWVLTSLSSHLALLGSANTFAGNQSIATTAPELRLEETDAASNNQNWALVASGEQVELRAYDDSYSSYDSVLVATRTGTSIDQVALRTASDESAVVATANGGVALYYDNLLAFQTQAGGVQIRDNSGDQPQCDFYGSGGTLLARIQETGSALTLSGLVHGNNIVLSAEDAGGSAQTVFQGDPDGAATLFHDGTIRASSYDGGLEVRAGTDDTATRAVRFGYEDGTLRGYSGYSTGSVLELYNAIHGANVQIRGENAGGTATNILIGDPDGSTTIFHAGGTRVTTVSNGVAQRQPDLLTTTRSWHEFQFSDGTIRGLVGYDTSDVFQIQNRIHGANVTIGGEDAGGTLRTMLSGDPDATTYLRGDTTAEIQVAAGSITAIEVEADGGIVTPNSEANEAGFKGAPQNIQNGDYTLVLADAGRQIYKASGGAGETITIPANSSVAFPIGTIIEIMNDGGDDLSIAITTDTLEELGTGNTGTRTLTDNNKAILEKVTATLWKYSATG